ncbi:hypothetical protein SAMD00024442_75_4 [Candidatus Symbiothrix dinenymphae]|nr:hypothetical protein SAMD00024442_75_4 [Candidatus Symbiothrix dinenymphae]
MKQIKYLFLMTVLVAGFYACSEGTRFGINSDDTVAPGAPVFVDYKPFSGGVTLFYDLPSDPDVLSVVAEYTNNNQTFTFSASYFVDTLNVYGFADSTEYTIQLYAVDRTGNHSEVKQVTVVPYASVIHKVAETLVVKPGFAAFFLEWESDPNQTVNLYVDYSFQLGGKQRALTTVITSAKPKDRSFISNLQLDPSQPVHVKVRVGDVYGNITGAAIEEELSLYDDYEIPKSDWSLPNPNENVFGVAMCDGDRYEGRTKYVIDGIIDIGDFHNFMTCTDVTPFSFIINLGDYYELSRIVTYQRHGTISGITPIMSLGHYFKNDVNYYNINKYKLYCYDEDIPDWVPLSEHEILIPSDLGTIDLVKLARAGHVAYMYPDDPKYTKPTKWLRYEVLSNFANNSAIEYALSEITLFGKKQ